MSTLAAVSDLSTTRATTLSRPPMRRAHRVIAACAVFAGNALLLVALTFAGGPADAEPKPSAELGGAAAAGEPAVSSERAQLAKPEPTIKDKEQAPIGKLKSRIRKLMPVRDFGGY